MSFLLKPFQAGESINIAGVLSCRHKFCYNCIESWAKVCNTCPLCKKEFKEIKRFEKCGQYIDYKVIANRTLNAEIEGKAIDLQKYSEICTKRMSATDAGGAITWKRC